MSNPSVLSLYTGAGGIDYGLEAAGFETAVAVEMDHDCCETLRANRTWPVIERNILEVSTEEMLEMAGLKAGEVDLLVGGPPCQPFSKSGFWVRGETLRLDDPRASTLSAYLRVVEEARPRAFLLENVEGLAFEGKDEGLRLLTEALAGINRRTRSKYRAVFQVLNAADYGVPQVRRRLIMVASRDGKALKFPAPTHAADGQQRLATKVDRYRTAWDALADVGPEPGEDLTVKGQWADLLPSIPEGQNYLWHTDRMDGEPIFGWRRRYWSFLLKLAKSKPSWTIQAQPGPAIGPFHWESRMLGIRELCRLQTFPDDLKIVGKRISQQRQLGNAVPSLLAEVLGRAIRAQLLRLASLEAPVRLLPVDRSPAPRPEPRADVPRKYLKLRGKHSAHPGTGMGFRAIARREDVRA